MPAMLVGVRAEQLVERGGALLAVRQVDDEMLRQQAGEQRVHAGVGIAHRHRAGGVAVIAALEGDELVAPAHAAIDPVLHRHLHGDLDRDRAGVGEEHAVEIARQQRRQPPRQRQRLLVHQPAEHHMRHRGELALDRLPDVRMVVAVAGGPPGGDAVDQLAPVGEHDAAALGARDRAAAGAPSSSAHRAARRGRARPHTSRASRCFCWYRSAIRRFLTPRRVSCRAVKVTDALTRRIRASQARRPGAPPPAPGAGRDRARGRHLGRARRPAAAVVLLQRLSQPDPASGDQGGRASPRSSATASAPAPRGSSPAITRSTPSWRRGSRGSRAPRPPACSAPAISPMPASSRP